MKLKILALLLTVAFMSTTVAVGAKPPPIGEHDMGTTLMVRNVSGNKSITIDWMPGDSQPFTQFYVDTNNPDDVEINATYRGGERIVEIRWRAGEAEPWHVHFSQNEATKP